MVHCLLHDICYKDLHHYIQEKMLKLAYTTSSVLEKSSHCLFLIFLLLLNYCCPHSPSFLSPVLLTPNPPHSILPHPLSLSMHPLYMFLNLTFPLLFPITPLRPPLWSLLVYSLFPGLWFYLLTCLFC